MPTNKTEEWVEIARARMAAKGKIKPSTKAGAVRALWPAIESAIENGQTLKSVRDWLEEEGVYLTYNQLTSYVGRIRRQTERVKTAAAKAGKSSFEFEGLTSDPKPNATFSASKQPDPVAHKDDPLANVRARERNRPTFEYNPDFNEDELI